MSNIEHVLYNTIGTDFEKYLQPKDMLTLSKVSKTTREGELTTKFRELLMVTLREYEIFKNNNKKAVISLNIFFKHIPLGVIYKNYKLELGIDINLLLDYIEADSDTRLYVWMELSTLEDFKEYINNIPNKQDWNVKRRFDNLLTQGSIRNRPDILAEVYNIYVIYYPTKLTYIIEYYQATQELRDLYMKYCYKNIDGLILYGKIKNRDEYPIAYNIIDYDESEDEGYDEYKLMIERDADTYLHIFLFYATSFQEQETFKQFYLKHRPKLSKTIERILDDKSLKYNIDINTKKLFIDYDP